MRNSVQLVVGLVLGCLTTATTAGYDGVNFQTATVAATAASTIIAPRFWWAGLIVFWIGQSAGWSISVGIDFAADPASAVLSALFFPYVVSARSMLLGALIGAVLWRLVDLQRKRIATDTGKQDVSLVTR